MGWEYPLEQSINSAGIRFYVIGVVNDFHYNDFNSEIRPVFFVRNSEEVFDHFILKVDPENLSGVNESFRLLWREIAPDDPYRSIDQKDVFLRFFRNNEATVIILSFVSGLAVILACMGLFGLLSFNIQKKMKELNVRKVLGAGRITIIKLAGKEYFWMLICSFILGAPLGFWLMSQLIDAFYPDPKPVGSMPFLLTLLIMAVTITVTVSGQILRVTKLNPARYLRHE